MLLHGMETEASTTRMEEKPRITHLGLQPIFVANSELIFKISFVIDSQNQRQKTLIKITTTKCLQLPQPKTTEC